MNNGGGSGGTETVAVKVNDKAGGATEQLELNVTEKVGQQLSANEVVIDPSIISLNEMIKTGQATPGDAVTTQNKKQDGTIDHE